DIEASLEYQTDLVQEMYQRFLHRDADPVGQTVFVTALRAGVSQEDVAATIVSSPEYLQTRAPRTNDGFLDAVYQDVFHRSVDALGGKVFGDMLAAGASRAEAADLIFKSAEYHLDLVQSIYARDL